MIWTLNCAGHQQCSFLNGQLPAWRQAGLPLESEPNNAHASQYQAQIDKTLVADIPYILDLLGRDDSCIWDARSYLEYTGEKIVNAQKGGHIPGAHWYEWTDTLVSAEDLRLRPKSELLAELATRGITPDKEVITHCQTHRRSGLTYLVARYLGFEKVRCYDGSWFEWGNHPDTPVER